MLAIQYVRYHAYALPIIRWTSCLCTTHHHQISCLHTTHLPQPHNSFKVTFFNKPFIPQSCPCIYQHLYTELSAQPLRMPCQYTAFLLSGICPYLLVFCVFFWLHIQHFVGRHASQFCPIQARLNSLSYRLSLATLRYLWQFKLLKNQVTKYLQTAVVHKWHKYI